MNERYQVWADFVRQSLGCVCVRRRWADRRKYTKARKTLQYPTLPEGTKLITIPAQPAAPGQENGTKNSLLWFFLLQK